jgi:hypothetical protein
MPGHGEKRSRKQEQALAALLSESSIEDAAGKIGVNEATLRRWLRQPAFRSAYRQARRRLVEQAIGRIQEATGAAVDTLLNIARNGARDGDRVRAAVALLDYAVRGMELADVLHGEQAGDGDAPAIDGRAGVVKLLSERLAQLDKAELGSAEKTRLTVSLAETLLRALGGGPGAPAAAGPLVQVYLPDNGRTGPPAAIVRGNGELAAAIVALPVNGRGGTVRQGDSNDGDEQ